MGTALPKLNDVLEKAGFLSFEEQEILLDVLKRRHIGKRRKRIAANAKKQSKNIGLAVPNPELYRI